MKSSLENHEQLTVPEQSLIPGPSSGKKVIVLAGPTATGKSDLGVQLAKLLSGEIISADSMQVYRGMDIGTAKVSQEVRREVPHHLIDTQNIDQPCNVVDFCREAHQLLANIIARGRVPIIVGGTGFYIHSLIYGPPSGPPSVPKIREFLEGEMQKFGEELLFDKLQKLDPEYAHTITFRDKQKIVRALEIISITQQKVSCFKENPNYSAMIRQYDFRRWFIYYPREILYPRIEMRCEKMIEQGLFTEIQRLMQQGLKSNPSASQAIGYKQGIEYLESAQTDQDFKVFLRKFKTASRQYAKRQFTWYRKEEEFSWVDLSQISREDIVQKIINDYLER